ncbi:hypothetical protein D3C87_2047080 [compost metagenome]
MYGASCARRCSIKSSVSTLAPGRGSTKAMTSSFWSAVLRPTTADRRTPGNALITDSTSMG